jgi:hypothetical protein
MTARSPVTITPNTSRPATRPSGTPSKTVHHRQRDRDQAAQQQRATESLQEAGRSGH